MRKNQKETKKQTCNSLKKSYLSKRVVAFLATAFFISGGAGMPPSLAAVATLGTNNSNQVVSTVSLEQANAQSAVQSDSIPSGVAIQNPSPLSRPAASTGERSNVSQSIALSQGWNLISTYIQDERTVSQIFGSNRTIWKYQNGGYRVVGGQEKLEAGVGYWVIATTATTVQFNGQVQTLEEISVQKGWNLIGVSQEISVSDLASMNSGIQASSIYGFNNGAQIRVDRLEPGKGYWVYSSSETIIKTVLPQPEVRVALFISPATASESRADLDSFMALLLSKGITSITRDEVEALKPADTAAMHVSGAYYLSFSGDKVAVAFSGQRNFGQVVSVAMPGGYAYSYWQVTSMSPYSKILYKPAPSLQAIALEGSSIVTMGFTDDGLLAVERTYTGAYAYNDQGRLVATAEFVFSAEYIRDVQTSEGLKKIYLHREGPQYFLVVYNPATQRINQYSIPGFDPFHNTTPENLHTLTIPQNRDYAIITLGQDLPAIFAICLKDTSEDVRGIGVPILNTLGDAVTDLAWVAEGQARLTSKFGGEFLMTIAPDGSLSLEVVKEARLPVPEGWMRAASNENYALGIVSEALNSSAGITDQKLMLLDLRNGDTSELDRVQTPDGIIANAGDVSPDGQAVIYEIGTGLGSIGQNQYGYNYCIKAERLDVNGRPMGSTVILHEARQSTGKPLLQKIEFDVNMAQLTVGTDAAHYYGGVYTVDLITQKADFTPNVPTGWTRVPSLPNLAYQRNGDRVLVADLLTGEVSDRPTSQNTENTTELYRYGFQYAMTPEGLREIYWIRDDNLSLGVYDPVSATWFVDYPVNGFVPNPSLISSDGKYLAVLHNSDQEITVVSLCGSPSGHTVVLPPLIAADYPTVHFVNPRQLQVTYHDGSNRLFLVTIQPNGTLEMTPIVPEDWRPTRSNPNYAYQITEYMERHPDGYAPVHVLSIMNLYTGVTKEIGRASVYPNYDVFSWIDVSPDGEYLIYERQALNSPESWSITLSPLMEGKSVINIKNPGLPIQKIDYSASEIVFHVNNPAILALGGVYKVNLLTKEVVFLPNIPEGWTRAASNADYAFKMDGLALKLKDLVTGSETLVAAGYTGGYPAYVDNVYDVSPDGTTVIYGINRSTIYGCSTYFQKISDPSQKIVVSGNLNTIRFEENGQVAVVNVQQGSAVDVRVDTATLQYHVPVGWTRAVSNANYAFQVRMVGSYERLYLLHLPTATQRLICSVYAQGRFPTRINKLYDVSPDGTTVIYGTSSLLTSSTYVQRVNNSAQKLGLNGQIMAISYEQAGGIAVVSIKNSAGKIQRIKINLSTLRRIS